MEGKLPELIFQVLGFLAAIVATTAAIMNYGYEKFQTKENATSTASQIEYRLQRIEDKIDRLFEAPARKGDWSRYFDLAQLSARL